MANDTTDHAHSAPGSGLDPAVSALMAAVAVFINTLGDVPFGTAGTVLERMKVVREEIDKLVFAMLDPLAQMEASGELLAEGGEKTIKAYVTHAWGIGPNEAERLMELAQNLHHGTIPKTAVAIEAGALTVGEAAAVAAGVEREVKKRDTKQHPDADEYRAKMDTGMMGFKGHKASMSVKKFDRAANALGFDLNPDRPEKNEQAQFAERGARLTTSFAGFSFEAWGPVSDGERMKAALASFMAPYGTTEKTNADGATASGGAGNAGGSEFDVIPPGEAVTTRYGRTYDAFISAMGFAHGHHGHTNGNAKGAGTAEGAGTAGAPAAGGPAAGPDGFASGGADVTADDDFASGSGAHADAAGAGADDGSAADADGSASGGGCLQPPGTKAVINITVPLSALLGFGFAFKNDTDTNANGVGGAGATTAGANGNTNTTGATAPGGATGATGPVPGSGAGSGPDPGGGGDATGTATAGGTNTNTGPSGSTCAPDSTATPGSSGPPGSTGVPLSSGLAVTEDGTVLALSAVRAMAPTAQIRRLIFDDRTGLPLDLGRAHRLAPGYLRSAAFMGHTTCAWPDGCDVPVSQCEADHITEFSHGGTTTAANLQPLCSKHNRLKYRRTRTENTPNGNGANGGADGAEGTGADPGPDDGGADGTGATG
ncbi:HNH endonuclease signature motif containing protein [Nocardiopsis salina]|uniref:HNH endonuclease signature motif containing protein n=1 Tax=Nocardiopsis salina TaxID=245836 RepID=UPI00034DA7A8|nr:HNH endonuclease signature motif containing protein [Nocardiopsis salina]